MRTISRVGIVASGPDHRHELQAGGHALVADEPASAGGGDAGPAPYDLVLSGLAACTAITLRMYAQRKGWDLGGLRAELTLLKDADGAVRIERVLHAGGALDDARWDRLLDVVQRTPVTLTLRQGARIVSRRADRIDHWTGDTA